jgi:hypothetical protein
VGEQKNTEETLRTALEATLPLLLMATAIHAQVAPADAKRAARTAALIEWVKRDGGDNRLQGSVAQPMGLGHGDDIPVRRKAFQNDTTNVIYSIDLVNLDSRESYVVYRTIPGQTILWKMDKLGTIEAVLVSLRSGNRLTNDPHLSILEETMSYLECAKLHNDDDTACGPAD